MRDVTPAVPRRGHELNAAWFGLSESASAATNSQALDDALAALPAAGGMIVIPEGVCDLSRPWYVNKPVRLIGHGAGYDAGLRPSVLNFAASQDGIVLCGRARLSVVANLVLTSAGSGSGVGLRIRGTRSRIDNVHVTGFGGHGVFYDTAARTPSAGSESGGTATITLANHGFQAGEQVVMAGWTPSAYNGAKTILAAATNTFTFAITAATGNASVVGTVYAGNANANLATNVRSASNGGDGIRIEGNDSNIISVYASDTSSNSGRGITNLSSKNAFYSPHASGNLATVTDGATTMTVDYCDAGSSALWLNPYSEGSKAFYVDTLTGNDGRLISVGTYAIPTVWSGSSAGTPAQTAAAAVTANWEINDGNKQMRGFRIKDTGASSPKEWRVQVGASATNNLEFRNQTDGYNVLTFNAAGTQMTPKDGMNIVAGTTTGNSFGNSTSQKISFYGKTPIVQPAANADTSGATLAQLETEVNELKAMLRSLGLMAP